MLKRVRSLVLISLLACLVAAPALASGRDFGWSRKATILDVLSGTDGAQALVAAVLVVDGAGVLEDGLAELLGDRRADLVVFAPSNAAFESLLGLEPGALRGLTVAEIEAALPGLLPAGVGPAEVAAILLKHVGLFRRADLFTVSEGALLRAGSVKVADGSELPLGIGAEGVEVNREATIIRPDLRARNGYIHFIDAVILDGLLE
jgi:uncharacterized surface protein with fasciclin (FAS1) repeats